MAAKRRPPCPQCHRRHLRALVSGIAILGLSTLGGSLYALGGIGGSAQAQTAAFIGESSMTKPVVKSNSHNLQLLMTQEKVHAAQIVRSQKPTASPTQTRSQTNATNSTTTATPSATSTPAQRTVSTSTPTPTPSYSPTHTTTTTTGTDLGAEVLAKAETLTGVPYVYGGDTPSGVDCSGLVYWAAQQLGIAGMPRDTYSMLAQGVSSGVLVPTSNPQTGDLAFFGSGHVEFYIKQGETFGAQQPGTAVGYHSYGYGYVPTAFYRIV